MKQSLISLFLVSTACIGLAADFTAPTNFVPSKDEVAGHVIFSHPGGLYQYGSGSDERTPQKAFALGAVDRDDYQFFSWQEEEALWYLLQEQFPQVDPEKIKKLRRAFHSRIDWPRVIIQGQSTVCVPTLSKAKDDNWKDHLLCTDVKKVLE